MTQNIQTQINTGCNGELFDLQGLGSRKVQSDFSAGHVTSDAGALLLREFDLKLSVTERLAQCFDDFRHPDYIEHSVVQLVRQRVLGLALGYEDLNDFETLRYDPAMAAACSCDDVLGENRRDPNDKGKALAGKSTLNRLELASHEVDDRYKKISADHQKIHDLLISLGVDRIEQADQDVVVLDLDHTDIPIHGEQEARFFHGYYGHYCYLPLYIFCGQIPLVSRLRSADSNDGQDSIDEIQAIINEIRRRGTWGKKVKIVIRADSGFAKDNIMSHIESQKNVFYVMGLARNRRLGKAFGASLGKVAKAYKAGTPLARVFDTFEYQTLESWTRSRRVIGKAEMTGDKLNPRYLVTNIRGEEAWLPQAYLTERGLYEEVYCPRGDAENRVKEQMELFADRTSTAHLKSNQLRLWLSVIAYYLVSGLRQQVLRGTELANASMSTIRLKLLKIGALVKVSVRRIYISMSSSYPLQRLYQEVLTRIRGMQPQACS